MHEVITPPVLIRLVLVIAAMSFVGCGAQPDASPVASASAPAVSVSAAPSAQLVGSTFTSARYGYAMVVPDGWTVTETPGEGGVHPDEPGVDTFKDRVGHILSVVGEASAGPLAQWTCAIGKHLTGEHRLSIEGTTAFELAGQPARKRTYHLRIDPYVIFYQTVEVVYLDRGLTLSLESTTKADQGDIAVFDGLLGGFRFT